MVVAGKYITWSSDLPGGLEIGGAADAPGWASCIYFRLELCGDFGFPAPGWASCIYFRLELCGDFGFPAPGWASCIYFRLELCGDFALLQGGLVVFTFV